MDVAALNGRSDPLFSSQDAGIETRAAHQKPARKASVGVVS